MTDAADLAEQAIQTINAATDAPVLDTTEQTGQRAVQFSPAIKQLFAYLHASYGVRLASKFATGKLDRRGHDKGMLTAMAVWDHALARYSPDIVRNAVERCVLESPEYPPNLPQVESMCRALTPRPSAVDPADRPAVLPAPKPMPVQFERKGDGKDWARELMARYEAGEQLRRAQLECACGALRIPVPRKVTRHA